MSYEETEFPVHIEIMTNREIPDRVLCVAYYRLRAFKAHTCRIFIGHAEGEFLLILLGPKGEHIYTIGAIPREDHDGSVQYSFHS